MIDTIKEILAVVFGGRLHLSGKDRTFAKMPMWLAVLIALTSPQLLIVTALLAVAFGVQARIDKA